MSVGLHLKRKLDLRQNVARRSCSGIPQQLRSEGVWHNLERMQHRVQQLVPSQNHLRDHLRVPQGVQGVELGLLNN